MCDRGERCHVSARLGPGWNYEYRVKWEMLPVIISRAVHAQMAKNNQPARLVEVGGWGGGGEGGWGAKAGEGGGRIASY